MTASAAEALERLEQAPPDILLSDIGMPGMDGYKLMRRVRRLPSERGGRIPAAALAAYARDEDCARALAAGFQTHIPKPIEAAHLINTVASLAQANGSGEVTPQK